MSGCDFGGPVGEVEFRVFLLHHLVCLSFLFVCIFVLFFCYSKKMNEWTKTEANTKSKDIIVANTMEEALELGIGERLEELWGTC